MLLTEDEKTLPGRQAGSFRLTRKTVRIMKLMALLLFVACLQVGAKSYSQTVTLNVKNTPLLTVLNEIKKQTGYQFFFNESMITHAKPVTFEVKNAPLEDVLKVCFADQPISYAIVAKTVVLKDKPVEQKEETQLSPPPGDIHGRVTDSLGNPLVGASVTVKGSMIGTQTNSKGEYELKNVEKDATLVISYTGFSIQQIKLNGRSEIVVLLKQATNSLIDVVVSKGYYSTTQRLNTGDVTVVSGADIQKQPVSDPLLALEGRVPGLYINQSSGIPGAAVITQLRGQNSIANGNNPFYIVDGVPFTSTSLTSTSIGGGSVGNGVNQGLSPFNNLNPADIESIEVLKDADATAIYGSRGANGVILITTKKGKAGATRFDMNVYSGVGEIASNMKLLNTQQYLAMRHEAFANDGKTPGPTDYDVNGTWDTTSYTDWKKVLIGGTLNFTSAQGSLSGGNLNTQFLIGGGYNRQTTVFPGDFSDQKASLHFNLNHQSTDRKLNVVFSGSYLIDNNNIPATDLTKSINLAPDATPYDSTGQVNWHYVNGNYSFANPLGLFLMPVAKATTNNLIGNLNVGYEIVPGLQIMSSFGYTHMQMNQSIQNPSTSYPSPINQMSSLRSNNIALSDINTWIVEPQLNYRRNLGLGKLNVLVGTTFQQNLQSTNSFLTSDYSSDALIPNIQAAAIVSVAGSNYTQYRYNAFYARVNYDWQEKYLINLTARRDGSSRFGLDNQFGNFGAVGIGWIFSKENFIQKNLGFLSFGKLRASYGTTGNDQITDYQYLSTYTPYSASYQGAIGLIPTQLANPNYGWEVVKKLEFGLEMGFFSDRIFINMDYYRNRSDNQLVGYSLPSITGFNTIEANLPAVVQNTGFEILLNTINIKAKEFTWSSSLNISIPRNELVSFPNLEESSYANTYEVGKSLYIKKLLHYTGVDPQAGLYTFESVKTGLPTLSPTSQDFQFLKSVTQNYYGGFLNNFTYKGLQLEIFFQYVNQTGYNYYKFFAQQGYINSNQPPYVLDHWQEKGDITNVQKYTEKGGVILTAWTRARNSSDYVVSDASFIRLKNISLSYTLPADWMKKAHLQNAKIFIQGQNLLTITNYQGLDPETQGLVLPPLKVLTAGIQLTL